jgi:D-alanyl-D-alanine carboxypeptidase (penicillin-binding protein 5/6)
VLAAAVLALLGGPLGMVVAHADSTPAPHPTKGLGSPATPCPTGMTPTLVTQPAAKPAAKTPSTRPSSDPNVTTYPDGHTVRQGCAIAPPVPMVGPVIAPEHTVGGPALARSGVVTDLSVGTPAPPDMPHVSYVLADLQTGQIVASKAAHALLYPASTLKTLTSLVALPRLDPHRVITATAAEAAAAGTRVGIMAGNPYSVDDLFNGMVMVSGNDAAYAIADAYGGQVKILADMNAKAAALGAWDTHAVDPSGLDADGQHTSAYDLALIGRAVMALPEYRRHAALLTAQFPGGADATGKVVPPFQIQNHNPIIDTYPGVIGVKSGYTTLARNTFVVAATHGQRTLLLAEMGSVDKQSEATAALLDWGFAYAASARPVGTLVAAGAAQPPEWAAFSGAVTNAPSSVTAQASAPATTDETETISLAPSTPAPVPLESIVAENVSSWWDGTPAPQRAGAGGLLAILLGTGAALARLGRRRRGAYER